MKSKNFDSLFYFLIVFTLTFIAISCKEGLTEPHLTVLTNENLIKLQSAADRVITNYKTPGLAAYIKVEGEGELYITRGVSNLATNEPMNANNYFRIASITKTFTTETVLILVDEGKIDLNKSISSYLPEYNIPSGDKITIRMLGNMTSGLFTYSADSVLMTQMYNSKGEKIFTPEDLVAASFRHPLNFTPGSKYEYCNTNTIILGLLIKKVTGEPVAQVMSERIFQPLGLVNTFWPLSRFMPYPYTHGYSAKTGSLLDETNWSPSWGDAVGILISNFSDLKIWIREIYERNLLSTSTKNERFQWVDQDGAGVLFYGFGLEKLNGWIGHPGIIEGYNSQIFYHPDKKITIIISANSDDDTPAMQALNQFAGILVP
ncbi:MAG: serine hydrolase [Ignavibacteriales bacterium]|nr:serine hydrolase [Ignavibacteriales bacterium]